MSFFDFLDDILEDVSDAIGEFSEFTSVVAGLGDEFGEIMTDGTKEILVEGNLDWKSSYEIREDASSKISDAKNRYAEKAKQVEANIKSTQQRIDKRYHREVSLINSLSSTQYAPLMIDPELPSIDGHIPSIQLDNFDKVANFLFNGIFGHSSSRESAEEALYEAGKFEALSNEKIRLLNRLEENLLLLNQLMDEEDHLLDIIQNALSQQLPFNHSEIRQQLISLLSTQIFDSKMNIASSYHICLNNIKNFCKYLKD